MKTPLLVKFERTAVGLKRDLESTKTGNYNKETKLKRIIEVSGHALVIRQIINEEKSLNHVYDQLEEINRECNVLFNKYI